MIPASSIHFNGDDTAWLLLPTPEFSGAEKSDLAKYIQADRPCDTCGGNWQDYLEPLDRDGNVVSPCLDCVNGRHTFTVEVQCGTWADCSPTCSGVNTLRVSISPGMVLPIVAAPARPDHRAIVQLQEPHSGAVLFDPDQDAAPIITLPPDARPGMWAVLLDIHEGATT